MKFFVRSIRKGILIKEKFQKKLTSFFVCFIFLFSVNFSSCKKVQTLKIEKDKFENSDIVLKDYLRYAYDNEGNLKWKLQAKETYYFQKESKTILLDIYSEQYENQKIKAKLRAQRGEIHQSENLMKLEGEVQIVTSDGKILETEELIYNTDEQILRSTQKVKIKTKGTTITGIGLEADKNIDKYKILKPIGISVGDNPLKN